MYLSFMLRPDYLKWIFLLRELEEKDVMLTERCPIPRGVTAGIGQQCWATIYGQHHPTA